MSRRQSFAYGDVVAKNIKRRGGDDRENLCGAYSVSWRYRQAMPLK